MRYSARSRATAATRCWPQSLHPAVGQDPWRPLTPRAALRQQALVRREFVNRRKDGEEPRSNTPDRSGAPGDGRTTHYLAVKRRHPENVA